MPTFDGAAGWQATRSGRPPPRRARRARLAEFAGARHDILNETVHREVAATITEFILTAGEQSPEPVQSDEQGR